MRKTYLRCVLVRFHFDQKGAGRALVKAADGGNVSVVKVILKYWTGEGEMVSLASFHSVLQ